MLKEFEDEKNMDEKIVKRNKLFEDNKDLKEKIRMMLNKLLKKLKKNEIKNMM